MGRLSEESGVVQLVAAVAEHKKFKQLACYSIEALSKNLALPNTRWREYIDLAIEADAAKVVVDVIKQHPGKEDVLLTATNCLAKLAVNTINADVIAREGGVQAILLSAERPTSFKCDAHPCNPRYRRAARRSYRVIRRSLGARLRL